MTRKISAKVETYQNDQGEQKGRYVNIGVILSNQNGDYILLDPTVNLSGVLQKQNMMNHQNGKKTGNSVMCSVFDDSQQQQGNNQNNASQNANTQPANNQQSQQFQKNNSSSQVNQQQNQVPQQRQPSKDEFDDDIPF